MNKVSDLNLAIACDRAGITASLFIWLQDQDGHKNLGLLDENLSRFRDATGHCNLVLCAMFDDLLDSDMMNMIRRHEVSHIEFLHNLVPENEIMADPDAKSAMTKCKDHARIMIRSMDGARKLWYADAICVKGSDSAGFGGKFSVQENFQAQRLHTPSLAVIPYGGIGTSMQIQNYLDQGAAAVAIGTLFAGSQESCISTETKLRMTKTTGQDLHRFADTGQQALIMGSMQDIEADRARHWNKNQSLRAGIQGDGTQGLIYAGKAIDHVTAIRTVEQIVADLVKDLT